MDNGTSEVSWKLYKELAEVLFHTYDPAKEASYLREAIQIIKECNGEVFEVVFTERN